MSTYTLKAWPLMKGEEAIMKKRESKIQSSWDGLIRLFMIRS